MFMKPNIVVLVVPDKADAADVADVADVTDVADAHVDGDGDAHPCSPYPT